MIESEWKNFTFRLMTPDDFPALSQHMRENFFPDEPISAIVGNSQLKYEEFDVLLFHGLSNNVLSFAAFDKESGKMAGVALIVREAQETKSQPVAFKSPETRICRKFLDELFAKCDFFTLYQVEEFANLRVVSTHSEFRRQGLATQLFKKALQVMKEAGFTVVKCVPTTPYTRKIAGDLGFKEIGRRYYREIQDLNGELMKATAGDEEYVVVTSLLL